MIDINKAIYLPCNCGNEECNATMAVLNFEPEDQLKHRLCGIVCIGEGVLDCKTALELEVDTRNKAELDQVMNEIAFASEIV